MNTTPRRRHAARARSCWLPSAPPWAPSSRRRSRPMSCSAAAPRPLAAGRRALHLRGLQLVPAGRPLAVRPEGRSVGGRPRLPRRLLGPARLEGPLREPRVHATPGRAAGQQRRALQLHAAGRRRRPRPHRLAARRARRCRRSARRPPSRSRCSATARSVDRHGQPRAGAPTRLAAYWAVTEQDHVSAVQGGRERGRDAASRLRRARLPAGRRMGRRAPAPAAARLHAAGRARRRASAQRQPRRRRRRQRPAGAGREVGC